MRNTERNYATDIEHYFLRLAGKGLMLSTKDYNFIRKLGESSVPKEIVIKAIASGFEEKKHRGEKKPRSLFDIKREVEQYIKESFLTGETDQRISTNSNFAKSSLIERVIKRLDEVIATETRSNIRKRYEELRYKVRREDRVDSSNLYKRFDCLRMEFMGNLFKDLPQKQQDEITTSVKDKLPAEAKFYDEITREKTFNAFRDEIVSKNLGIRDVFVTR